MFEIAKKTLQWGQHTLTLETGEVARQASGAVMVTMDDTVVLATVVGAKNVKPGQDFFPLTVDYVEKFYAAGRIPGGFFKREGRPTEKEILTCRLIDRPLRPLFPDGFYNEVQIIIHVLSSNPEVDSDIPAMIGASAALAISGIPFNGPIGACRVGYVDGQYVLNPNASQLPDSKLDLVVAGTDAAVMMVESEANQLPEDVMLGAVVFGHGQMQAVIKAIAELVEIAGKPEWDWKPPARDDALIARINELAEAFRPEPQVQAEQRGDDDAHQHLRVLAVRPPGQPRLHRAKDGKHGHGYCSDGLPAGTEVRLQISRSRASSPSSTSTHCGSNRMPRCSTR